MILHDKTLGECEVEIYVDPFSSVDSYIESGYDESGNKLSDIELNYLQEKYQDAIQEYAYQNGSRNHN